MHLIPTLILCVCLPTLVVRHILPAAILAPLVRSQLEQQAHIPEIRPIGILSWCPLEWCAFYTYAVTEAICLGWLAVIDWELPTFGILIATAAAALLGNLTGAAVPYFTGKTANTSWWWKAPLLATTTYGVLLYADSMGVTRC
jgi:hypothetical protein